MGSIGSQAIRNSTGTESTHAANLSWNEREAYLRSLGVSDPSLTAEVLSVYIQNPDRVGDYTKQINEFIEKSPKYKGKVYRGVVTDKDYKVGETLDEGKISSWTSEHQVAREYSGSSDYESENAWNIDKGQHAVIFVTENAGGVSISRFHSAGREKYHKEVITPSSAKFTITKVEEKTEGRRGVKVQYVYLRRKK